MRCRILAQPAELLRYKLVECSFKTVECRGFESHPRQLIFLWKSDCLGCAVLLCLVVCLTLLASFLFPSSSLINTNRYRHTNTQQVGSTLLRACVSHYIMLSALYTVPDSVRETFYVLIIYTGIYILYTIDQ